MGNNNYFIRTFQPLGKVVYFRLIYYFGQHIVTRYFTVYVAYPEQLRLTCNKRKGKSTKKFMIIIICAQNLFRKEEDKEFPTGYNR